MNMNQNKQTVTCPKCAHQFNADEVLSRQIEDKLRQSFEAQSAQNQAQFEQQLKAEKATLEQNLKVSLAAESEAQIQSMRSELNEQSEKLREFNKAKAEIERLQREKDELRETIEAESEIKHSQRLAEERQKIEHTLKASFAAESADQIQSMRSELNEQSEKLREFNKAKAEIERLQREKGELRETIEAESEAKLNQRLREEKQKIEQTLKANFEMESEAQIQSMRNELNEQSEKLREFNKAKAEIERLMREKSELKETLEAESEAKLNQRLREEKQKIESGLELKMREKDFELENMKRELQEVQRRAEQGSTQLQGEVQELAIEEWLRDSFPFDEIEEIKKGQRGADCIQIVHTRSRQNCGMIYYESKRTQEFGRDWIEKLKGDLRAKNIRIGVLVTQTMPKEMERMGLKDGVWVCTFEEFKGLSAVLRQSLIDMSDVAIAQENKGEKMEMLYGFLTSNEFKSQIEAIVDGFTQMQNDLEKERRVTESGWKQREKQLQKVLINTTHLYGSIRGIAGEAIQAVPQLESSLPVIESTKPVLASPAVKPKPILAGTKQDSLFN
jgi:hypothetical protein